MRIGAIGSFQMYQPYIYNTNRVSARSMEAIDRVDNDVTKSHIEPAASYAQEVENPVPRGQSLNFADILNSQMQMGMHHAARIFGDDSVFA